MTSCLNHFLQESSWLVLISTFSLANESDKWNSDLSTEVCFADLPSLLTFWTTGNDHPSYGDLWTLPQSAFSELTPTVIWSTATKVSSSCRAYPETTQL